MVSSVRLRSSLLRVNRLGTLDIDLPMALTMLSRTRRRFRSRGTARTRQPSAHAILIARTAIVATAPPLILLLSQL